MYHLRVSLQNFVTTVGEVSVRFIARGLVPAILLSSGFSGHSAPVALRLESESVDEDLVSIMRGAMADESTPETMFEARRQSRRAADAVYKVLNSEGYYDPTIEPFVETGDRLTPILRVDPGKRFIVSEFSVRYGGDSPREADQASILEDLELAPGDTAIPTRIIDIERVLLNRLHGLGYAFARARDRSVLGDREAGELEIVYNIVTGPRVRFGEIIYPDNIRTRTRYLQKLEAFETGELYDPQKLNLFGARLDETRLYSLANAQLAETSSGQSEEGDQIYDVIVSLAERKRNTIAAGASISTDKGVGVSTELTRRNLTRNGDLLVAALNVAELEQEIDVQWRRPNEFGYGRGLVLSSRLANENTDGFDRQTFSLGAGMEVIHGPQFSYGYGVTASYVHETDDFGTRDLQLLGLYANTRLDRADGVLNPTRGWRFDGRIEPNVSFGGQTSQFIKGETSLRGYYPLMAGKLVMAGRIKIGSVYGADINELPSTKRFFAGGGGSVRGYSYQAIGPRSDDNVPLGGRGLLETSVEARYMVRPKIGVAAFIDGGSVSARETPDFSDLRLGAGFGVRYDTPAGPLRIDIATPLDKTENDDVVQVYISLGQAF
ncbi:MAG: outer membrane protein assembly factor [Ponticaulis sp.]|nr:outer membrane protein assembly factor [Ponticaulis sp.]|tara:strand:+ start:15398 stop:17218 length:1821 start_codon:yes stop_codon:yes gene_type:complete